MHSLHGKRCVRNRNKIILFKHVHVPTCTCKLYRVTHKEWDLNDKLKMFNYGMFNYGITRLAASGQQTNSYSRLWSLILKGDSVSSLCHFNQLFNWWF